MTETQWLLAKEITADAFEREPSARAAFVESACGADPVVRSEVLRLLVEADRTRDDFLSKPPLSLEHLLTQAAPGLARFTTGQNVTPRFRIERFLGVGGMGEVYAAMDLELHESVALKTIRPAIASSADVIERFKREVKESRRIADSNVCRVYDLFSFEPPSGDPIWFLTMELLEGHTLREALTTRAPIPFDQAIPLIGDMVAALAAAHTAGIVHRDFKPGNIMLVKKGTARERAVATDFGLALNLGGNQVSQESQAKSGTPAYMSPEQATGRNVGFETDQYALGIVICEMLTGSRPALDRSSPEESSRQWNAWLKQQPRRALNANTRRAIRRCLQFQPERRFRHVSDVMPVLNGRPQRRRLRWAGAAAALLAFLAGGLAWFAAHTGPHIQDAVRVTPEAGLSSAPAISRDGKWIAYSSDRGQQGNLDIWIQPTSGGPGRRLTTAPTVEDDPSISPDGSFVAFHSERNGGGVYVVGADGLGERLLAPAGRSPAFSPDGRSIAFWTGSRDDDAPSGQLFVVPRVGGTPRRLAADFADARFPAWDSTGQYLIFDGCREKTSAPSTCADWWVVRKDGSGARNTGTLSLLKSQKIDLSTPPQKAWRGDQIIFSGGRDWMVALWSLSLSKNTLRPLGVPRNITPGDAGEREPAVSDDGSVVFGRITAALHIWRLPLKRGVTPAAPVTDDPAQDGCPSVSRDGHWLYFTRRIRGVRQLLVRDLLSNRDSTAFASDENKFWPVSSPSGDRAVFEIRHQTDSSIWIVRRGGQPRKLCTGCSHPTSWFNDTAVFYTTAAGEIALLDVVHGRSQVVLSPTQGTVLGGADWNATNQYLLFTTGVRGASKQVFAVRFPAAAGMPQGPWKQLTSDVAEIDHPHWSADGKTLYFFSKQDASNCIWARPFSAVNGVAGRSFAVMHYHDTRLSPDRASPLTRGLTVAADSIFVNVGEVSATLWMGKLAEPPLLSFFHQLFSWRRLLYDLSP